MKFLSTIATYLKDEGVITFGTINDEAFIDKAPSGFNSGFIIFTETYKLQQENSFGNKKLSYQHRDCQIYVYGTGNDIASARQKAFSIYNKLRETNSINDNVLNTRIQQPTFINDLENNASCYLVEVQAEYVEQIDVPQQQTLQDYINILNWSNITASVDSQIPDDSIQQSSFVGLPDLTGITVTSIQHNAITSSGNYTFTFYFSAQNQNNETEFASKEFNCEVQVTALVLTLKQIIDGLSWSGITYSTNAPIAENTLGYFDLVNAPQLPDDVTVDSISHQAINASGNLDVAITFSKSGDVYTKTISVGVTISILKVVTIGENDYTGFDNDGTGERFIGFTLSDTSTIYIRMIAYIKTNLTIKNSNTFYDNDYNTVYTGSIRSLTFDLIAGKTYQFEDGKDPIEVGN